MSDEKLQVGRIEFGPEEKRKKAQPQVVSFMEFQKEIHDLKSKVFELEQELKEKSKPVDMLLFCPKCGCQHIDQPQPEKNWTNPPHKSHECQECGCIWRPSDVPTNGIDNLKTRGKADNYFFGTDRKV